MDTIAGNNAIVLANGVLESGSAKTAHGLIRGTERFTIVGVIDHTQAGRDAGEVLDGKHRSIPVFASVHEAKQAVESIQYCIVGVALAGGKLPADLVQSIHDAIASGMNIINGLHDFLADIPEFAHAAAHHDVKLIDVRRPKKASEMEYWSGRIMQVTTPRIAVLGTDCALGKRTTAKFLVDACRKAGLTAEMIYTGQTGWMQGFRYGFIFDSTLNDFITGELETAIVRCFNEAKPDIMFIEGQSALRNPIGPAGSEFLVSGQAKYVVLQHAPARKYFKGTEEFGLEIPSVKSEIELLRDFYGAETLAVTLNTKGLTLDEARIFQSAYREELEEFNVEVCLPIEDGVESLVEVIRRRCLSKV
jgi:uncharacterized NAD-dependent epimerase/dehydratase family protein